MRNSILLDEEHGVNPTMTTCFYCGEAKDILLVGKVTGKGMREFANSDGSMPMNIGVVDMEPCRECSKLMEQGIMIMSIKIGDESENPYRTGRMVVVQDDFIERLTDEPLRSLILNRRFCFMPDDAWEMIKLPDGESDNESN